MRHTLWALLTVGTLTLSAQAQVTLYSTSWEAPTFTAGSPAPPNDGWANGSGSGASQTVTNEQARTGSQSLKWNNTGTSTSFYSIRRAFTWSPTDPDKLVVSTYVWVSSSTQANRLYGLYLTGSATGTLGSTILGITIGGDGTVRAGTSWSATYSSGVIGQAAPGTYTDRWLYMELTIDRNASAATAKISGFSDGAEFTANFTQATVPANVNIGTDYVTSSNHTGVGYFDDLEIRAVPGAPFEGWDEQLSGGGDAGDLPATAQIVTQPDATPCQTPIQRVRGDLDANDVDMYVICITDPNNFVASTVDTTSFDTQLWLFRCDGTGVVFNDDNVTPGTGTQSRLDNSTGCITQPGTYLLAISRYNRDAVDANGQLIWNSSPFRSLRCPDGPGAANPVAGWTGTTSAAGRYLISLQGAYFVSAGGCVACQSHNGDVDNNGCVDDADLLAVLFAFGQSGQNLGRVDVNCDEVVDDSDLLVVLFNFGSGC